MNSDYEQEKMVREENFRRLMACRDRLEEKDAEIEKLRAELAAAEERWRWDTAHLNRRNRDLEEKLMQEKERYAELDQVAMDQATAMVKMAADLIASHRRAEAAEHKMTIARADAMEYGKRLEAEQAAYAEACKWRNRLEDELAQERQRSSAYIESVAQAN